MKTILRFFRDILNSLIKQEEMPSPSRWFPGEAISIQDGVISLDARKLFVPLSRPPEVWAPGMPNTGSMDPVMDYGNSAILVRGTTQQDQAALVAFLRVGDKATFVKPDGSATILHRITHIELTSAGKFFRFRGDNNPVDDPYRVPAAAITHVSLGVLYGGDVDGKGVEN